jgi:hypothetical protein
MAEMPSLATLADLREMNGRSPTGPLTGQDFVDGYRPIAVEYSPVVVPFFQITYGRLDFAVIKVAFPPESLVDENFNVSGSDLGSYLLVRRGFKGLGPTFAEGGWWKFDPEHTLLPDGHGLWDRTRGQIPLFPFIGEPDPGTTERPAIARSLTMELGQIAVSLMNRMSERNYNVSYAAKSINYILGIGKDEHGQVIAQQDLASITIGVPPVMYQDGRVGIPSMWNSSAAAIDATVFESIISAGFEEARELMVKQVTSGLDASGAKVMASFAEATSPLLARLAGTRQQAMNTFLYFASLLFRVQGTPDASVTIPRDFNLQPLVDDIDEMLSTLKRSWLRSPTWEAQLLIKSGEERNLLPEDPTLRKTIEDELAASATPTEPMDLLADDLSTTPGRQGVAATPAQPPTTPSPNGNTPSSRAAAAKAAAATAAGKAGA